MRNLKLCLLVVLAACSSSSDTPSDPFQMNDAGIAIGGYSPVSYFTDGIPEKGSEQFAVTHAGATYLLTDDDQVALFQQQPDRYVPAHGGWCTLMLGGSGRRTPGHPENFVIIDDRLMLFWSGDTEESRGLGLRNWATNTGNEIERQREWIADADENWTRFLSGDRRARIHLYKPGDRDSINTAQAEDARIEY